MQTGTSPNHFQPQAQAQAKKPSIMMSEETKAQKGEGDKDQYPPAHITPLEVEEGRAVPSTEGRGPVNKASAGEKTTCQRLRVWACSLGLRESVCLPACRCCWIPAPPRPHLTQRSTTHQHTHTRTPLQAPGQVHLPRRGALARGRGRDRGGCVLAKYAPLHSLE